MRPAAFSILSLVVVAAATAKKLLFLPSHLYLSHKMAMWHHAESFAASTGHNVTFFSPNIVDITMRSPLPNLVDQVVVVESENELLLEVFKFSNSSIHLDFTWFSQGDAPWDEALVEWLVADTCESFLRQQPDVFRQLAQPGRWDLLVIDVEKYPCAVPIAVRSNAPFVLWSTSIIFTTTQDSRGIPAPTSYVQGYIGAINFTHAAFFSRVKNFVNEQLHRLVFYAIIERFIVGAAISYANHSDTAAAFEYDAFEKRALFAVAMYPDVIETPIPRTPDFFILPPRCRPGRELDAALAAFVEDPRSKGTIVVTMGTLSGGWANAPRQNYIAFRDALRRLRDYRIVWQCDLFDEGEGEHLAPTGNIWKRKWVPQNDLLHHPKARLFVSHTGLSSVVEAICAGVAVAAMPLFADQYHITANVVRLGFGVYVDKLRLSEEYLYNILKRALDDDGLSRAAQNVQRIAGDQILPSDQYATYLLERAIKHGGRLRLLHSRGAKLSFAQLYSLDTGLFVLGTASLLMRLFAYFLGRLFSAIQRLCTS